MAVGWAVVRSLAGFPGAGPSGADHIGGVCLLLKTRLVIESFRYVDVHWIPIVIRDVLALAAGLWGSVVRTPNASHPVLDQQRSARLSAESSYRRRVAKMARQPLPFGAAAGSGSVGPPLSARDAGMELVSTLAWALDPWTERFWPDFEDHQFANTSGCPARKRSQAPFPCGSGQHCRNSATTNTLPTRLLPSHSAH